MIGCEKLIWSLGICFALNAAVPAKAEGLFDKIFRDVGKTIEKSAKDVGSTIEKGTADVQNQIEQSPTNPCIANPQLPQCNDLVQGQRPR